MKDELREAAEIAGTRAFPAHPHFRGTGAALYIAGYEAGKPKWIPVSERLPDIEGWYLVDGEVYRDLPPIVTTALYENGRWSAAGDPAYILVVAWQPLPESYTEGE